MDRQKLLKEFDAVCNAGNYEKIEAFIQEKIQLARSEGDWVTEIMLNNEHMGLYRERGLTREALAVYGETRKIFEAHGLTEDISFASTLLNAANVYRADGQLTAALELFDEVRAIYEEVLPENDYRMAGLYNNMGLAYMAKGERYRAREYMQRALRIIEMIPGSEVEQATSHVNLANCFMESDRMDRVEMHLAAAQKLFDTVGCADPHYSSLLSLRAMVSRKKGELAAAAQDYRETLREIEKYYGKSRSYATTCRNLAKVLEEMGDRDAAEEFRGEADRIAAELR